MINLKILSIVLVLLKQTRAFVLPRFSEDHLSTILRPQYMKRPSNLEYDEDNLSERTVGTSTATTRRKLFSDIVQLTTTVTSGCACCLSFSPQAAYGLAQLAEPSSIEAAKYDVVRNKLLDAAFAQGMAVGMRDYEKEAYPIKKALFAKLFSSLSSVEEPSVVEVGMGSFPNALYYKQLDGMDIIGVDPNDSMEGYARDSAERAGLVPKDSLRIVHGVSEALPFPDKSIDAVVCTLTLCSVVNPEQSIAEIKRILKPGGKFLFWEHVLSQTNLQLAQRQIELTPQQVKRADGCHLDRRTGTTITNAGFKKLDMNYIELKNFSFLNPTVCGIATA